MVSEAKEVTLEYDSKGRLKNTKDSDGLTAGERRFVQAFVENGGNKLTAVKEAGYSSKHPLNIASKLLSRDRVLDAIQELVKKRLSLSSVRAVSVVDDLMDNAKSEYVRLQSAMTVLDRTGLKDNGSVNASSGPVQINIDLG